MRLLIIGSDNNNSIERYYLKYLSKQKEFSHVEFYGAHDLFLNYYQSNVINKILFRLGLSSVLNRINNSILKKIKVFKPDVLLVFKGMEIFPETLHWIKKQSVLIVNYNTDNPFVFTGRGSGNKNIVKSISLYDLFISYDKGISEQVKTKFRIDTSVIPFAFEEKSATIVNEEEKNKLCFIGNEDVDRLLFINKLAENNIQLDLYGDWNKKNLHSNIQYFGKINRDELLNCMNRYRIQLNLLRRHNQTSHNMRTFEIPAAGSIQLAPLTIDHLTFFEPDKEIFLFRDIDDCICKIKYLLSLKKNDADDLRYLSQKKLLASGYSYYDRSIALTKVINEFKQINEQKVR